MIRVKVCGITNKDDALYAADSGADALGFIFYKKSPRYISPEKAARIIESLPPYVDAVGVFVNESGDTVHSIAKICTLGVIQLHGDEAPDFCRQFDVRVIKAFRMDENFHPELLKPYKVAGYLLDTAIKGSFGGTGKTFNWQMAIPVKEIGHVILSGGLSPDNIVEALSVVRPPAVDVSSGVESSPGRKDRGKVKSFIQLAKNFI